MFPAYRTCLPANSTNSHIHCCTATPGTGTAGVATILPTFTGFPSGVQSGSYALTFDMTQAGSYNAAFLNGRGNGTAGGAFTALLNAQSHWEPSAFVEWDG